MSASMAEVLAEHQLYVNTSHGDAWNPPEESASCSCGAGLGGWVASGADWEWPDGWGKEHGEHVAEQLAANGYGKLAPTRFVLREREAELLKLNGPCSWKDCRLHYAHSGPCDRRPE